MPTYKICTRLPSHKSRFEITLEETDGCVLRLHEEIVKSLNVPVDFDIIYAGQVLKSDSKISSYAVQNLSTLYVLPKFTSDATLMDEETTINPVHKNEVLRAVKSALSNGEYKIIVERMLANGETVENLIATTPGLDKDPSVLAMLLKPELLLQILVNPSNLDSLLKKHPSFAQAAVTLATAVNEEGAKSSTGASYTGALSYSMDQMSDEDDDVPGPSRPQASGGSRNITASQLAEALQAATSSASQSDQLSSRTGQIPREASTSGSGTAITTDFLQLAMLQAQNSASSDAALQQLRDMGITDDNVARQALAATNGDIQAALDLIFGDGFM